MRLEDLLLERAGSHGSHSEKQVATEKAVSNQSSSHCSHGSHDKTEDLAETGTEGVEPTNSLARLLLNKATLATLATSLKTKEEPGSHPKKQVATVATDPADWQGKVEDVTLQPEPAPWRASHAPASGSLVQRLVAAGASFDTYGSRASIRAPAGIPLELVQAVEARGWRIIPGGKPNPEAEHDSWLAGVPIADLSRGR